MAQDRAFAHGSGAGCFSIAGIREQRTACVGGLSIMSYWAPVLLVVVTAVLIVVPVVPALHELRHRRDAKALPTSGHDGRIKNLAESFQSRLEPFREEWEACRAKEKIVRRRLDGMEVLLVGREKFDFDSEPKECVDAVMC